MYINTYNAQGSLKSLKNKTYSAMHFHAFQPNQTTFLTKAVKFSPKNQIKICGQKLSGTCC